jgi:hypothetical protein
MSDKFAIYASVDGCFCLFVVFHSTFVLSVLLRYTGFDYPFGIFKFFLALVVSSMYNSLIPWLSFLLRLMVSDNSFGNILVQFQNPI